MVLRVELSLQNEPQLLDLAKQDRVLSTAAGAFLILTATTPETGWPFTTLWGLFKDLSQTAQKRHGFL